MSETKHTPGPWVARDETNQGAIYSASLYPGRPIAKTASYWDGDGPRAEERQANADLIAAAPDLLEALKHLCNISERSQFLSDALQKAESAIAKATNQ